VAYNIIFTRIKYNVIARFVKNRNSNIPSDPILSPSPAAREQMVDCNGRHLVYTLYMRETHKRPIHTACTTGWYYIEKLTFVSTPLPGRGENLARSFNLIAHIYAPPPGCPPPSRITHTIYIYI